MHIVDQNTKRCNFVFAVQFAFAHSDRERSEWVSEAGITRN